MTNVSNKRKRLIDRDGLICMECKNTFDEDNLTTNHIIPKALGGSSCIENQRLLCLKCHKEKNKLESKVKDLLGRMVFGKDKSAASELYGLGIIDLFSPHSILE